MGNEHLPNIYSMTADISYKKGKRILDRVVWIVSRYDIPADIMSKDTKTMDRLETELYGKTYKGIKSIMIRKIRSKKAVGKVNSSAV
jgi:hypothetical protein